MTLLLSKFCKIFEQNGVSAEGYTRQCLKLRLQKHFADSIVFHQPSNRSKPELVYSSEIKVQDIINACAYSNMQGEKEKEKNQKSKGQSEEIFRVAKLIQGEIKKCKGISMRPLDVRDVSLASTKQIISLSSVALRRDENR